MNTDDSDDIARGWPGTPIRPCPPAVRSGHETAIQSLHRLRIVLVALFAFALASTSAIAQNRLVRDGVVLYWGLVPAAIVSQKHAIEDMHGAIPPGGGQLQHLVVALFNPDGSRIDNAIIRAQVSEIGIVDSPPKYLTPMAINGQASYGQIFTTVLSNKVRFRLFVRVPNHDADIEYVISATPPQSKGAQ
ncbi:hypothetical protein [Cupriavidus sp. a3]|uniref:hypothetical protein n=1 Tax=Cupriavidus sp. a3 TaxID=3242158 RepID=UPI003D9C3AD8